MIIAIDGPAGGGKSALASLISKRLGFFLLNSGLLYRAITALALQKGLLQLSEPDIGRITELAEETRFSIIDDILYVNHVDMSSQLHTHEVDRYVAHVSSIESVRNVLNENMRKLVADRDTVCEGRDMTSVVFPEAKLKIFLDASVEIRAKRRFDQEYSRMSLDEIQKSIQNRDEIDKTKAIGALKIVPDAWYIESSDKSLEDVYHMVASRIEEIRE
ncbi:(d)CMP kinase [Entomospira entomophila]|uniref:Cytidylate kinase n=1 Tax=Entomospira entomophila TaxID=2719988 RepID=A0A968KR85_9SPIO|nr:(d)CMP kinase [Entomospira entomophilus]NIZ40529.1 (d)CMP kinase [Entomospira entomophilus]WDI36087.1 (d)CMP kinase [Entomospira entomophilus]